MYQDPIVAEVRAIREAYAQEFNFDLQAIFRDMQEQEKKSGGKFVSFPPRPAQKVTPKAPSQPGAA